MTFKFGREYSLTVDGANDIHNFTLPTTMRFDMERNIYAEVNFGRFSILNLKASVRDDIYVDRELGQAEYRGVSLSLGYASQIGFSTVFKGNIKAAYSERQGSDLITHIEAFDGAHAVLNGFVAITRPKEWNFIDVTRSVMQALGSNVKPGTISPSVVPHSRGITLNGSAWTQLQRLANTVKGTAFIDKEVVHLLSDKGTIVDTGGIRVIESATGLLNAPKKMGNLVSLSMVLEPRFDVGSLVILNSLLNETVNGAYKVIGFHHYGTVSEVESGEAITDVTLLDQSAPANA